MISGSLGLMRLSYDRIAIFNHAFGARHLYQSIIRVS
jgi:hypothetical protein